jgi:hypothetical protein
VIVKKKAWSDEDTERLRALVASGASALRASVVLRRSLSVTKNKARSLGVPFPSEAELRAKRRRIFLNSTDGPWASARWPINEDI